LSKEEKIKLFGIQEFEKVVAKKGKTKVEKRKKKG